MTKIQIFLIYDEFLEKLFVKFSYFCAHEKVKETARNN